MLSVLAWPCCLMRNLRRVSLRLSTVLLILESVAFAGVSRDAIRSATCDTELSWYVNSGTATTPETPKHSQTLLLRGAGLATTAPRRCDAALETEGIDRRWKETKT